MQSCRCVRLSVFTRFFAFVKFGVKICFWVQLLHFVCSNLENCIFVFFYSNSYKMKRENNSFSSICELTWKWLKIVSHWRPKFSEAKKSILNLKYEYHISNFNRAPDFNFSFHISNFDADRVAHQWYFIQTRRLFCFLFLHHRILFPFQFLFFKM